MDYRFAALLGAPYRGGNLLIHDNELLTPVGNRVTQVGQCFYACLPLPPLRRCRRRHCRHLCTPVVLAHANLSELIQT